MKKWLLFALLLVPYLAVDSVRIGNAVDNANDPLAVHKWDNPWDSDLNVSGYILGNTYLELPENLNDDCGLKFILGTDKVSGEARLAAYYTSGYCVNGLSYTNKTLGVGLGAVADGALNIGGFYIAKGSAPWPAYGLSAVSEGAGIPIMVDSCSYTGSGCDDEFDSIASVGSIVLRNCEIDAFGNLCDSNDAMLCFGGSSCYTSTAKMYWDNSENSLVLVPGSLMPYSNGTGNLGSSSYFFDNAYINYINTESITAPDGELSINSNVVVDNGLASSTLRVKSDRDSELVLEDNIVNQTIRTKGGYLVLSPDAGWMEVNPVLNDSILLGSAPLQWNSLYANNLYSSRIYPDYTDVAKSWGIGKLDLGIFGTYPTLEPYSDGLLGNVGAIHNGMVVYTNPLTGDVGDPSLVLIKIGVGSATMAFDSSDAPGTFRFDSNIKSPSGFGHYFVDGTGNYKSMINQDGTNLIISVNDTTMNVLSDVNITAPNFIGNLDGKANNATYADDSNLLDGYDSSEFAMADDIPTRIFENETWIMQDLHVGGQFQFNNSEVTYNIEVNTTNSTVGIKLPKNTIIFNSTLYLESENIEYHYYYNASDDSYSDFTNPSTVYGNSPVVYVYNYWPRYGYYKFNLTTYANETVTNATVCLYKDNVGGTYNTNFYIINQTWYESNMTYNNAPTDIGVSTGTFGLSTNGYNCLEGNLKYDIFSWLNGTTNNEGWKLSCTGALQLESKENTYDPYIDLFYVNTTNLTIDVGNDGNIDYISNTSASITVDLNVTAINDYIESCTADLDGFCTIPIIFNSESASTIQLSKLSVLYDADIYARDVYASQYYGKNITMGSFDDPTDFNKDSSIAKSISVDSGIFIFPNEFYKRDLIDLDKVWSWSVGAIKEYAWRIGWLEGNVTALKAENEMLKLKLNKICSENELKGCT